MLLVKAAVLGCVGVAVLGFMMVEAPQMHQRWLNGKVGDNVRRIIVKTERGYNGGTGFQITAPSGNTYFLTNRHVCGITEDDTLPVELEDGRSVIVRKLEVSKTTDLCLTTSVGTAPGLELAGDYEVGQDIAVVGHPRLEAKTPTRGIITNKQTIELYQDVKSEEECTDKYTGSVKEILAWGLFPVKVCSTMIKSYRTTAIIYGGNSGSPVVNFWGNVVGIVFAADNVMNLGYAVPLEDIKEFLKHY